MQEDRGVGKKRKERMENLAWIRKNGAHIRIFHRIIFFFFLI